MKRFNHNLLSSLLLKESKCKFSIKCGLFSSSSITCMSEGGNYCGKYRALEAEKEKSEEGLEVELQIV